MKKKLFRAVALTLLANLVSFVVFALTFSPISENSPWYVLVRFGCFILLGWYLSKCDTLSPSALKEILIQSSTKAGNLENCCIAAGYLNVHAALSWQTEMK